MSKVTNLDALLTLKSDEHLYYSLGHRKKGEGMFGESIKYKLCASGE